MKSFLVAASLGLSIVLIVYGLTLGAASIQADRPAGAVIKAAIQLSLSPSNAKANLNREGTLFLFRSKEITKVIRYFERNGWELTDEAGYGYVFENETSRMTVTTRDLDRYFRVGDVKIEPKPARKH